jgi:hypothetical protein
MVCFKDNLSPGGGYGGFDHCSAELDGVEFMWESSPRKTGSEQLRLQHQLQLR